MADTLGKASLELSVDLEKFSSELRSALAMVKKTLGDMGDKTSLDEFSKGLLEGVHEELGKVSNAAKETGQSIDGLGAAGGRTLTSFAKFELMAGVIDQVKNAFGQLKTYVMDLTGEYADAELVQDKLRMGLERIGSGNYFDKLKQQADELHKITPFDDNDITNMQAMMTTFDGISGEMIERLTPSLLNLSSAFARAGDTGMNLQQVAIMIGESGAMEVSTGLQRVGIVMTETEKEMWKTMTAAERFAQLEEILARNSNITAESFGKTLAGQIKISENAFGDINEAIGKAFAPLVIEIGQAVQALSGWFQELSPAIQAAVGVIGLLIVALTALAPVLAVLGVELGGIPILIGALVTAIAGIAVYVSNNIDSIKAWVTEMAGGEEAINNLKAGINELWEGLKDLGSFIYDELVSAFVEIKDNITEVIQSFTESGDSSETLSDRLRTLVKDGFETLKNIIHVTIEAYKNISKAVTEFITKNPELVGALKWLAEAGFGVAIWQANALISVFGAVISWAGKLASALTGVVSALAGLTNLTTGGFMDAIFNPDKFRARLDGIVDSIKRVGDAFKENAQQSNVEQGFQYDSPIGPELPVKKTETRSGATDKKGKNGKDEKSALQELTAEYEHQLKLMDDKVKIGERTVAQQKELYAEYQAALEAIYDSLTKTEDIRKAEEKIADLKLKQIDVDKKTTDEQKKLEDDKNKTIADVDKFIEKRRSKVLDGITKETADIEANYKAMEDKVTASKLSELEKQYQYTRLNFEREKELVDARLNSEKSAAEELKQLRNRNEEEEYNIAQDAINKKYDKEKDRITKTYAEGKTRNDLLRQLEMARVRELEAISTESGRNITNSLQAGFTALQGQISTAFRTMWSNVFGEANSLFEMFVQNVIAQLTEIAASSLFTLILKAVSGGGFFDFLGGGASGAFAGGGYTGDGMPDEIAGVVHKGEYVVNQEGTAAAGNREWLELMNRGESVGNMIASVMSSVKGVPLPDISNFNIQPPSRGVNVSIPINGVNIENKSLSGLSEADWKKITAEAVPKFAAELDRIGEEYLTKNLRD